MFASLCGSQKTAGTSHCSELLQLNQVRDIGTLNFPNPSGCGVKRFGGFGEGETPGPIPNPEVKPLSADGTARETVWESRTPPDTLYRKAPPEMVGPFAFSWSFVVFGAGYAVDVRSCV